MKIELLGWKSNGLRCPDIEVKLRSDEGSVSGITLIQMPNGTGKTTTLSCLRAAIDGSAERWGAEKVLSFKRIDSNHSTGEFKAALSVNGSLEVLITMSFHFDEGVVTYQTSVGSSIKDTYAPPPEVRRYLDPRFSELLFFDGETASNLLEGKGSTSASQIIDTFYGLYHITELKDEALSNYALLEENSGPVKGAAGTAKLAKRRDAMQKKLDALKEICRQNKHNFEKLKEEYAAVESELEIYLLNSEKFKAEEEEASKKRDSAVNRLEEGFRNLDQLFIDPWVVWPRFGELVGGLIEGLNKAKLTQQPPRLYLEDLSKDSLCVCDRPMDAAARAAILQKAQGSLEDPVSGFLKSLQREFDGIIDREDDSFSAAVDSIQRSDNLLTKAKVSLKEIRNRAENSGDIEVSKRRGELERLSAEIHRIKAEVKNAERPSQKGDNDDCGCIDYFAKKVKSLDSELANLSGTQEWKDKTDCLVEIIDEAYGVAHSNLKKNAISRANKRLAQILRYNPVEISDIGASVTLDGRDGASVGQTLAVGYVFLAGLLHEGGNQFPLVVDSPVGSLDDEARRELGGLLPILTKQLVIFVIASEREWFVQNMEEASNEEIQFLTHLRKNDFTNEIILGLPGERVSESENGVLIGGRDAFYALGAESGN